MDGRIQWANGKCLTEQQPINVVIALVIDKLSNSTGLRPGSV